MNHERHETHGVILTADYANFADSEPKPLQGIGNQPQMHADEYRFKCIRRDELHESPFQPRTTRTSAISPVPSSYCDWTRSLKTGLQECVRYDHVHDQGDRGHNGNATHKADDTPGEKKRHNIKCSSNKVSHNHAQ